MIETSGTNVEPFLKVVALQSASDRKLKHLAYSLSKSTFFQSPKRLRQASLQGVDTVTQHGGWRDKLYHLEEQSGWVPKRPARRRRAGGILGNGVEFANEGE